jgi:UDP-N-acetylmuramate: L-alanyl-gamma-D-glutamyl-meso-diaminopimelate ligase
MKLLFYSPDAVKIKQLKEVTRTNQQQMHSTGKIYFYTSPAGLKDYLNNSALLLMSSGNYGGLNFDEVKELLK